MSKKRACQLTMLAFVRPNYSGEHSDSHYYWMYRIHKVGIRGAATLVAFDRKRKEEEHLI